MDVSALEALGQRADPASNVPTGLSAVPSPSARAQSAAKLHSPENPLFWWAVGGAVVFGLMAFSTSVRVGHTSASLNLGSTS